MITNSEKQTIEFGKNFARKLKGGEVVLLIGDLGAGKTTFVKGVAKGFGITKNVTSPTFVLMKTYEVKNTKLKYKRQNHILKSEIKNLIHIDTYRGLSLNDLENIGALEYFGRQDTVCFVEWGAGLEKFLKNAKIKTYKIKIKNINQNTREFNY